MRSLIFSTVLVLVAAGFAHAKLDPHLICPPPDTIAPCRCEKTCTKCNAVFVCTNLTTQDQLDQVLSRSGDFPFRKAVFEDSTLQYIPRTIFEAKQFRNLVIKNSVFSTLIDEDIQGNPPLQTLWLENLSIQRGFPFQSFKSFKQLDYLHIEGIEIKKIPNDLADYFSSKLVSLEIVNTKTLKIGDKAFAAFPSLETLAIKKGLIKSVSGSMFPKSLLALTLSENKIKSLPDGFADGLTKLDNMYLDGNQLTSLEESVFGNIPTLTYVSVTDNPIVCDCKLRWKLSRKRPFIKGKCTNLGKKNIFQVNEDDLAYC